MRYFQRACRVVSVLLTTATRNRWVGIVGGLALVDVIVGVDDVVATLSSPISSGDVGHAVGVHVDGGTGAALVDIDRELIEHLPVFSIRSQALTILSAISGRMVPSSPLASAAASWSGPCHEQTSGTSEIF